MKFHWLLLSFLSIFLLASPGEAGTLVFWRFDSSQNRLSFSTDEGVQPKAQLISNPTRLIIDLPGTNLERPTFNQPVGGKVTSVRVGQFQNNVTRLVVELAPGYTLNPQKIKITGSSPTRWTVDLPTPERIAITNPPANQQSQANGLVVFRQEPDDKTATAIDSQNFQITDNGLFIRLDQQEPEKITVNRNQELGFVDIYLDGITLPRDLRGKSFPVNRHGVEKIDFFQSPTRNIWARISLKVSANSPDWQASFNKLGGLVLLPEKGNSNLNRNNNNIVVDNSSEQITIKSLRLARNNTEFLIEANRLIKAESNWNRDSGIYEVRINNAKISDRFRGPDLEDNSPISVVRVIEEESESVLILIKPARGVKIEGINQPRKRLLALQLEKSGDDLPDLVSIPVPPPERNSAPPQTRPSSPILPRNNYRRALVVIDPGHGGKDPGTIGISGVQEKNIILPISRDVSQILSRNGIQVIMTRSSDYFVSLEGRAEMANRVGADLFISIHANAINLSRPDVNGLETYYFISGQELAETIHRNVLQRMNVRDRRVRSARFYVLRKTYMPSVLVEVGFLTGREDYANLQRADYRRRMAEAIANGILEYIRRHRL